jgi:hypothetical protein
LGGKDPVCKRIGVFRMKSQKINGHKYLAVFALTTLIFIVGMFIGSYFSSEKLDKLDLMGQDLKTDAAAIELQYELLAEEPCKAINSTPLAEDLYELSAKLDYMENRLGDDDPTVLRIKEYYSLLEIRHWLFLQKTKEECMQDANLVLYFYSNEDDCKNCEEQGFILTWLRKNYPQVNVYSFDINLQNSALKTLKELFNVELTPTLVFDGQVYDKFMSKNELVELVEN